MDAILPLDGSDAVTVTACELCDGVLDDGDQVVQLESADLFHAACFAQFDGMMDSEVAKRCDFSDIHEDWKR